MPSPAQLERLFQFERLGKETSTIEGTGLSLIARYLAVAMGGSLHVASPAGIGTRILVDYQWPNKSFCTLHKTHGLSKNLRKRSPCRL